MLNIFDVELQNRKLFYNVIDKFRNDTEIQRYTVHDSRSTECKVQDKVDLLLMMLLCA